MNTTLLNSNIILAILVFSILGLSLGVWNFFYIKNLRKLSRTFFGGKNGADLEHVLLALTEQLDDLGRQHEITREGLKDLREFFRFAIQKVGLVKFNPFDDSGGNFSFSLALLDEQNSGIILTNMHGRQQTRIYTKNIVEGQSDMPLTEEEKQALEQADRQVLTMTKPKKPKTKSKTH